MTSTKIQINYNTSTEYSRSIQKFNACTEHGRSNQNGFGHPPAQSAFGTAGRFGN